MGDAYRRTGRGGAGNFYSQKDVAEIEKRAAAESKNDPEAQKPSPYDDDDEPPTDPADPPRTVAVAPLSPTSSSAPQSGQQQAYARSGRGGAGNFVDATSAVAVAVAVPAPHFTTSTSISTTTITPNSTIAATTPRAGLSGRGGAGNWATAGAVEAGEERERRRREVLDRSILRDMKDSLPRPPEKIYRLHGGGGGAGRGRVKELEEV